MLSEKINADIKDAMIKKEKERLQALRYLKAMLIENNTSKTPIDEMDVLIKHVKKLKDSLVNFPEGNEIRKNTEVEIECLAPYMPKALSESEVIGINNNPNPIPRTINIQKKASLLVSGVKIL